MKPIKTASCVEAAHPRLLYLACLCDLGLVLDMDSGFANLASCDSGLPDPALWLTLSGHDSLV